MLNPPDCYIDVGTVRARYWALGDHGSPVVLVHGIMRFVEDWEYNIHRLAQDHRVYAVDLVGYGRTDKPDIAYSHDDLAEFLHNFLITMGIDRATLIGHSLGGGVVIDMAHRYPQMVERLVLVSSAGFGRRVHRGMRLAALPWLPELLARPNRLIIGQAFKEVVYDSHIITPAITDLAYEMFYLPGARRAIVRTLKEGITLRGLRPELLAAVDQALPSLTMPVLLMWGKQDRVLPVEHGYSALERLPNASLHVIEKCGHFPMLEHPAEFNHCVRKFLMA